MDSAAPPPKSQSGVLVGLAILAMLAAAGGVLWYMSHKPEPPRPVVPPSASVTTAPPPVPTLDLPPIETPAIEDAGNQEAGTAPSTRAVMPKLEGCPATCTGEITDAIKEAAHARAASARQCYKTALEGNEGLSGEMTMVIRVGTDGQACSVSVVSDTTGSSKLQQCARAKMVAGYPKPHGGCVDVRVPVIFKPKT